MNGQLSQQGTPTKPPEVIDRARPLEDAGDHAGARALLFLHLSDFAKVPPFYHAAIGRLSLALYDFPVALKHLHSACLGFGEATPPQVRRNLGLALLQTGQIVDAGREFRAVEAAGGTFARAAVIAAMEAYDFTMDVANAPGTPNPYCVVAIAELAVEQKIPGAASELLRQVRPLLGKVPASYDAAMGRLAINTNEWAEAVGHLTRAREAYADRVPVSVRLSLGSALYAMGQFDDAGRELSQALALGAHVGNTELRVVVNAYRRTYGGGELIDARFGRSIVFADSARKLVYISIPKNACSLLKANFVMNSPYRAEYLASGKSIHEYGGRLSEPATMDVATHPEYFRIVVLRHPARRVLSAYLNKFVRARRTSVPYEKLQLLRTIREAQLELGMPYDPDRSITFEEFVRYLSTATDVQCDVHWMPQVNFVGTDLSIFDHIGRVEHLDKTLELLESRFGFTIDRRLDRHIVRAPQHITKYSRHSALSEPYKALPRDLDAFEANIPLPEVFYTGELASLIEKRYAADFSLYAQATASASTCSSP